MRPLKHTRFIPSVGETTHVSILTRITNYATEIVIDAIGAKNKEVKVW